MKLSELKTNMTVQIKVMVSNIEERTAKNGSKFLTITFSDGESTLAANLWDQNMQSAGIEPGDVLQVKLDTKEYNGRLSASVGGFTKTGESPDAYVLHAPIESEEMYRKIYSAAGDLGVYSATVKTLLSENREELLVWGAAKNIHHNIRGGLLYHMFRMLQTATRIYPVYKGILRKELLYAGVILHDIGKLRELNCGPVGDITYSVDGDLFGHLYIGAEMVQKAAEATGLGQEETRLLKHMIVSHHGTEEMGAVKKPAIPEAALLHHIDCMDAEMYQYEDVLKTTNPGEMSTDRVFGLRNVRVYHSLS
ncbi:MAG: HD domain-containing protein [Clostridiales bacterium]|nr:HD domain-containing protein [Clostridiales bacterium]